jgi:hypothetical protein
LEQEPNVQVQTASPFSRTPVRDPRSHRVDLGQTDRGIRFVLIIVKLELFFRIYLAAALPQLSQNVCGLNLDRFAGDLRAMPNSCWLSSRGLPGTHGIQAISMPIENYLE